MANYFKSYWPNKKAQKAAAEAKAKENGEKAEEKKEKEEEKKPEEPEKKPEETPKKPKEKPVSPKPKTPRKRKSAVQEWFF